MDWLLLLLELILFLFLSQLIFTIPGYFILGFKLRNQTPILNWSLATLVGFVAVTLISYVLSVLHIHVLLLIICLLINFIYLKKEHLPIFKINLNRFQILTLCIFIFGVIGQLLVIAPSGLTINNDVVFWSAHGHDGVWHLALAQELQKNWPFQNPDFTREKLVNYHFFSDVSIADLNYFFHFSPLDLYFRFFPLIFAVLLGNLSFYLGKILGQTKKAGFWAMVFTFFAGSFGFIVSFFRDGKIGGENLFWSSQVQSLSGNPPQEIACVVILAFFVLLIDFLQKPNKRLGLALILLAGTAVEFKIYAAVVLLLSLGLTSTWYLIRTKNIELFLIFIISSILAAVLYLPNTSASENLLLFQPWWFIRTLVLAPDRLNWIDLEHRRQTYLAAHNYLRVAQLEIEAFLIFLLGNLGLRFFGFWELFKTGKKFFYNYISQLIIFVLFFSLVLPMLFIQKGIPANTIQFFVYFLLISGIFSGITLSQLLSRVKIKFLQIGLAVIIILLAVPTQIGLLNVFYSRPPFARISQSEIAALNYLKSNSFSTAVVLSPPFQKNLDPKNFSPPIWVWSDTSYVPAFSGRQAYVTDIEQLDIMGYDFKTRQGIQKQIYSTSDPSLFITLLRQNQINYLYFPKILKPEVDLNKTSLQIIMSNDKVEIWKVN